METMDAATFLSVQIERAFTAGIDACCDERKPLEEQEYDLTEADLDEAARAFREVFGRYPSPREWADCGLRGEGAKYKE